MRVGNSQRFDESNRSARSDTKRLPEFALHVASDEGLFEKRDSYDGIAEFCTILRCKLKSSSFHRFYDPFIDTMNVTEFEPFFDVRDRIMNV